jgi:hypothetical protein
MEHASKPIYKKKPVMLEENHVANPKFLWVLVSSNASQGLCTSMSVYIKKVG